MLGRARAQGQMEQCRRRVELALEGSEKLKRSSQRGTEYIEKALVRQAARGKHERHDVGKQQSNKRQEDERAKNDANYEDVSMHDGPVQQPTSGSGSNDEDRKRQLYLARDDQD